MEYKWVKPQRPSDLLKLLPNGSRDSRKSRLLAVALCGYWTAKPKDRLFDKCVRFAERLADGLVSEDDRLEFIDQKPLRSMATSPSWYKSSPYHAVLNSHGLQAASHVLRVMGDPHINKSDPIMDESTARLCEALIRDIFGNPYRPVILDPRWRTSTVVDLADAIYDEHAFDRMPILGDALMDAGCDSDKMILHCRGDGPHVRGCWVVDLILGKE